MRSAAHHGRLESLLSFLAVDPLNDRLIADAAQAALSEGQPEVAADLLAKRAEAGALPAEMRNLQGVAALSTGDHATAARCFQLLIDEGEANDAVRFNLAWALTRLGDADAALHLVQPALAEALPQAALLRVQLLHDSGAFDEAAREARGYVSLHDGYAPLMAAVSVLALDVEDEALATRCAALGGDHPDALSTRGTLALGENDSEAAMLLFERALAQTPDAPRALIGRGLANLASGRNEEASADMDRAAALFEDHLGTWIAAGWTHFVRGDLAAARARFDTAMALDANFAETHGSLAVLDIVEGDRDGAVAKSALALRLDRNCYSAALARSLIAGAAGDEAGSRRIFERAVNTPVDASGRTIAQALTRIAR